MSPIQDTDLFPLRQGSATYRATAAQLKAGTTGDVVVRRGTSNHRLSAASLATVGDADILPVGRGGQPYRVSGAELKAYLAPPTGPWTPLDDPGLLAWFDITDAASFTLGAGSRIVEWRARNNPAILASSGNSAQQAVFTGDWVSITNQTQYSLANHPEVQGKLVVAPWQALQLWSSLWSRGTFNPALYMWGSSSQIEVFNPGVYSSTNNASGNRNLVSLAEFCVAGTPAFLNGVLNGTSYTGAPWGGPPTQLWWDGSASLLGAAHDIVVSGSVDIAMRQKHEGFLAHKAGIAGSLPANHPFRSAPPTK